MSKEKSPENQGLKLRENIYFEGWYIACDVNKRRTKIKRNGVEKK